MNEGDVRRMAGWIGVDLSRSRVRTPGKPGYGLYRVRTAAERHWHVGEPPVTLPGEWTAYAFTLGEIQTEILMTISTGKPSAPGDLTLRTADRSDCVLVTVPTRWTRDYEWVLGQIDRS